MVGSLSRGWCVVGGILLLLVTGAAPAQGKLRCLESSGCAAPEVVAAVRGAIASACSCEGAGSRRSYLRCAKGVLKSERKARDKTSFPKPCVKEVARGYKNSTCGRSGVVLCNKTNKRGRTSCKAVPVNRCPDEPGRSAPCPGFTSCADACNPAGGCATPSTSSSTTTTTVVGSTTVTTASTVTTTVTNPSSTVTTVTTTSTTFVTVTTIFSCVDQGLGGIPPFQVNDTTAGMGDDVAPDPSCLIGVSTFGVMIDEDVLYEWTAPSAGIYAFDTLDASLDTVISVLDGCGGTLLACNDDPEGFGVLGSRTEVTLSAGQPVVIAVDSRGTSGAFTLYVAGPFAAADCCVADAAPGCEPPSTETCVCGIDGVCCSTAYDDLCVFTAINDCAASCR